MKSSKQRRREIKDHRTKRAAKAAQHHRKAVAPFQAGHAPVNESLLKPYNSYGGPDYVMRGYYADRVFTCKDCGKEEVWTATQQKWWYEIAKGEVWSVATRCRACRRRERERQAEARRIHLEGVARKGSKQR